MMVNNYFHQTLYVEVDGRTSKLYRSLDEPLKVLYCRIYFEINLFFFFTKDTWFDDLELMIPMLCQLISSQ